MLVPNGRNIEGLMIENLNANQVYVVLGIDAHEHDQVLAVCVDYVSAKQFLTKTTLETEFYDLWVEKHVLL
jgi:hypothetical protein